LDAGTLSSIVSGIVGLALSYRMYRARHSK
jgi:uncharacterized membrane protein